MTTVQAGLTYYKQVNEQVRGITDSEIAIENVVGQRYLGCGSSGKTIIIHGTPGNGLGQYLNGSTIEVFGNAQEAVGDTMNERRHHHPRQRGRRLRLRHARRAHLHPGRLRLPRRHPHEGLSAALSRCRHRRPGGFLPRRISGGRADPRARHRAGRRLSGEQFLRHRYARRQNCVKM